MVYCGCFRTKKYIISVPVVTINVLTRDIAFQEREGIFFDSFNYKFKNCLAFFCRLNRLLYYFLE